MIAPRAGRALGALLLLLCAAAAAAWVPTDRWEPEVQSFEEADRAHPPPQGAVLFVGSSSIRLWHGLAADFPGVPVINRGIGGTEIADATALAHRIVVPYRPRMIVLYAGDNDIAGGRSPRKVRDDFATFVARVRRELPAVRIAFIAIKPSPLRAGWLETMREANRLIAEYCEAGEGLAFIDVFTPMLGADGRARPELFVDDGLHLNRAGYDLWKALVAPHLR